MNPFVQQRPPVRSAASAMHCMLAWGLGATLTTRHLLYEKEADQALGLPEGVRSWAILPIGWPLGKFGPIKRAPLADVVYQDKWGQPYKAVS